MAEFFDDPAPPATNDTNPAFGGAWGDNSGEQSHASQQPGAADDGLGFGFGAGTVKSPSPSQSQHGSPLPAGQPDADDGMGFGIPHVAAPVSPARAASAGGGTASGRQSLESTGQGQISQQDAVDPLGFNKSASVGGGGGSLAASTNTNPSTKSPSAKGKVPTAEEFMQQKEDAIIERGKAANDQENKKIEQRIATGDKEAAETFTKMRKTADHFHKEQDESRKTLIKKTHETHREEQKGRQERLAKLQRGGSLWEQTNEFIDTSKPPKFAEKNTDRMRNLLKELRVKPNAKQVSAAA